MFVSRMWLQFKAVLLTLAVCQGDFVDPTTGGLDSLFKEIGFSPSCVSQTLARCEKTHSSSVSQEMQNQLKTIIKSVEELKKGKGSARNCADLLKMGDTESGVRTVYPFNCCENRPVSVFCDQTTDGGGWTVFQHREDLPQREDFYRKYVEYQLGFGNLTGEFWLGLENIHALVSQTLMELRVDLEDFDGDKRWAKYEHFYVDDSSRMYRLNLGSYTGNAGDSLSRHDGAAFSAKDVDNDTSKSNCAVSFKGAWWYVACHDSNLNGFQYKGTHATHADGINWKHFRGHKYSLKSTLLSVRPRFVN